MTATDVLRRLLDERGVEHYDGTETTLWLKDGVGYRASADEGLNGYIHLHLWCTTPEQAIAATLGATDAKPTQAESSGTCHNVNHGLTFVCSECGANIDATSSIGYSYVDEFGKRWYGVSNDYGLNYCPNCGAKVVYE